MRATDLSVFCYVLPSLNKVDLIPKNVQEIAKNSLLYRVQEH